MQGRKLLERLVFITSVLLGLGLTGCDYEQIKQTLNDSKNEIEEKTSRIEELGKVIEENKTEIENLSKTIQENATKIEELSTKITELNKTLESKDLSIEELIAAKDELGKAKTELEATITATENSLTEANKLIEENKGKIADLEKLMAEKQSELEKTSEDFKSTKEILEKSLKELSEAKDALQKQYDELSEAKETLQSQFDELKENYDALLAENEKLKEENKNLSGKIDQLKTVYVNPLQLDVKNVGALAVKGVGNTNARYAGDIAEEDINLVIVKEDGTVESAIAIGTEKNAQITEAPKQEATENPEEAAELEAIYQYVSEENNIVGNVLETIQCPYDVNDVEARGYYLVFDKVSTFTYEDGTKKLVGPLIYVTPDGEERDILKDAGFDLQGMIDYSSDPNGNNPLVIHNKAYYGNPYIFFDENGNAFFLTWSWNNEKKDTYQSVYRYQPVANRTDDITPAQTKDNLQGISNFAVSLDGKYFVYSDDFSVKAVKISDRSVTDVYKLPEDVPANERSVTNVIYMDKNHSFYFSTISYGASDGKERKVHRWNCETKVLTSEPYTYESNPDLYNNDLWSIDVDPFPNGELMLTEEGIFCMIPTEWNESIGKHESTILVKFVDSNGDFTKCEMPESVSGKYFNPPLYTNSTNMNIYNPSEWHSKPFVSNGKGIILIGDSANASGTKSIFYYKDGVFNDLLAMDYTEYKSIDNFNLSDTSVIFTGSDGRGNTYKKSINLDNGAVTELKINGAVVNVMAVKGARISSDEVAKTTLNISIKDPDDLVTSYTTENNILKINVQNDFDKYIWSCTGVVLQKGSACTFEKDVSTWSKGFYPIYVKAIKNGLVYASFIEVEVK